MSDNVNPLPPRTVKKVSLNLVARTVNALANLRASTGHNQTDALNRGAQWLDICQQHIDAGGQ